MPVVPAVIYVPGVPWKIVSTGIVKSLVPFIPPIFAPLITISSVVAYPLPVLVIVNVATPPAFAMLNSTPLPVPVVDF